MFPCTNFGPSGRVDNSDVILEIRINKGLQFCYQYHALHMARAAWIDVLSCFLNLTFTGTYQWIFGIFPENGRSRKQIDRRNRRSSIYFTWCKINSYSINDFIISISCLSVCLYLSRLLSLSTILPSSTTSASASTTIDMPFSTYNSFLT